MPLQDKGPDEAPYWMGAQFPVYQLIMPIEGMREQWREGLLSNYPRPNMSAMCRQLYTASLRSLIACFEPPAVERALPIARFQHQLEVVTRLITQAEIFSTLFPNQPHYQVVLPSEVEALRKELRTLAFDGFIVKRVTSGDGALAGALEEAWGYFSFGGDPDNTWVFRVL